MDKTPSEILGNPKYDPWFQNCIGAIDGTHISAWAPSSKQISYRGRKVSVTQNIMLACSFNMMFTYVYTGWEGTANDSRVLMDAITREENRFPMPQEGKYYVVDSGYANMSGFLAPYRKVRYHLRDFRGRDNDVDVVDEESSWANQEGENMHLNDDNVMNDVRDHIAGSMWLDYVNNN
ncbi:uncharacterized protein [Malus domestica]|uniref:uncharacterized protein n=1 Tax=Malus domestica TaxID=3750 RepID=UPI0010AA569A|nr:uncharacterized protein LOC103433238 [Malus domestica]